MAAKKKPKKPKTKKEKDDEKKVRTKQEARVRGPKRMARRNKNARVTSRAKARYICPVDGVTIGRLISLSPDNRWLCECPYDGHRWYASVDQIAS